MRKGTGIFVASAAMLMAMPAAVPASAAGPKSVVVTGTSDELVTRQVRYRDLDITSAQGERELIERVHFAVNSVCHEAVGGRVGYLRQTMSCQARSWSSAQPQIERAVERARDIAANGWSAIAPVAITIGVR